MRKNGFTLQQRQPKDGDVIKTMFLICGRPVIIFSKLLLLLLLLLLNNDKCGNDKHWLTDSSTSNCFSSHLSKVVSYFMTSVSFVILLLNRFNGCQNLTQNPLRRLSHAQEEAPTQNHSKRHSLATNLTLQGCYQVNSFFLFRSFNPFSNIQIITQCVFHSFIHRHRWTGRYEAHLWDKTSWNQAQNKKGRQGSLIFLHSYKIITNFISHSWFWSSRFTVDRRRWKLNTALQYIWVRDVINIWFIPVVIGIMNECVICLLQEHTTMKMLRHVLTIWQHWSIGVRKPSSISR